MVGSLRAAEKGNIWKTPLPEQNLLPPSPAPCCPEKSLLKYQRTSGESSQFLQFIWSELMQQIFTEPGCVPSLASTHTHTHTSIFLVAGLGIFAFGHISLPFKKKLNNIYHGLGSFSAACNYQGLHVSQEREGPKPWALRRT